MSEILTAEEVAAMLKISKRQVYELAKQTINPIPAVRIRTSVRFRRADVDGWVASLVGKKAARALCKPLTILRYDRALRLSS